MKEAQILMHQIHTRKFLEGINVLIFLLICLVNLLVGYYL